MKILNTIRIATSLALVATLNVHANSVTSTFDTNADGWYITNYDGTGSALVNWVAGTIQTGDVYSETSFHAPTKFNGDWSSLYGSSLSFDLTEVARDTNANSYYTAIIASGSQALYWYGGAPLPTFSTFIAPLTASDTRWRLGGSGFSPISGATPTEAQFKSILSNVTRLQINAEFVTGNDNTRLDNVVLGTVPEPQGLTLLVCGLAFLAVLNRKSMRKSVVI
jgi:hypothetical protein